MGKNALLPFLLVAALAWVVFAGAGLWFTSRLENQHLQDVQDELALVAVRAASNVAGYVDRVTRSVESVLATPLAHDGDTLGSLSTRFRILSQSYPEIRSLVYVDSDHTVFTAAPGQDLHATALLMTDVLEGPALEHHLSAEGPDSLRATVTEITRYEPSLDRVVQTPVLLFTQQVSTPSGENGTVLIPYLLDFIAESLLRPLASPGRRELSLISHQGMVVYSTLPAVRHGRSLPSFAPESSQSVATSTVVPGQRRDTKTDHAFVADFQIPGETDEAIRFVGYFAPMLLGDTHWTVAAASRDHGTWPSRNALLFPPLLGSLVLVLLLCGVALVAYTRTRRHLREIARFRTAVASSGMGIAVFDRDDQYLYVNPAYTEITGAQAEQVLGREVQTRSQVFEDPELLARVLPQVRAGRPWSGQARLRSEPKEYATWRDLAFTVSPILERGAFQGYVVSALDMTSEARTRRQLEAQTAELVAAKRALEKDILAREKTEREKDLLQQELRRSQTLEAVGQLAGGVAHDFNNILASIIGCLYVVEQQVGSDPAVAREIESVKDLCKRGGELNRQLLAVGRRDTGRREPVDAGEFLSNLGLLLKRTLPIHIALTVDIPDGLPPIRGNRSNLLAAFLNLGLNARDAMPDGGNLEIRCHLDPGTRAPGSVVVEVEDDGEGIPAEIQDRVFEPFFTTKTAGLGTGLGLATAYAAVEECGGTITLRSTPGVGTRFTVQLPVVERRTRQRTPTESPVHHPATDDLVLLIEDEEGIERLIRTTLEGAGYAVVSAATGTEALALIRDEERTFGAVTLDLMLPEVSGTEVLEELHKARPGLPVLVVTARDDLARSEIRQLPYLPKPFTSSELLEALGELLHRSSIDGGIEGTAAPAARKGHTGRRPESA